VAYPVPQQRSRYFDANGKPLSGGKLYTYNAGTTVPKVTYSDASGLVNNTNPIILDSYGYCDLWIGPSYYKFVLKDLNDVVQWTADNVSLTQNAVTGIPSGGTIGQVLSKIDNTNYNAQWITQGAPTISGTIAAPINVTVAGIIFSGLEYNNIMFVQGSAGPIAVTANPQISVGTNVGQKLRLIQKSAVNSISFTDGTGLSLLGGPLVLDTLNQSAEFIWDGANWVFLP
jgi:hypothetical protein